LSGAEVNRLRMRGYAFLFASRLFKRPLQTYKLLRTFSRHMKAADLLSLLTSPFRRRNLTRQPELPAGMQEPLGDRPLVRATPSTSPRGHSPAHLPPLTPDPSLSATAQRQEGAVASRAVAEAQSSA